MKKMIIETSEAIQLIGTKSEIGKLLGISKQAVANWDNYVPQSSAWKLHILCDYAIGEIHEEENR